MWLATFRTLHSALLTMNISCPYRSQTFNWAFWCSVGFSSATALASVFYVYRAIRPPTKSSRCSCRNIFVTPCFVLLVFLSWTFAMVFVIGSIGLADTCYDSPDDNFKGLLQRIQNSFSPLVYKSIIFYVSGKSMRCGTPTKTQIQISHPN